MLRSIASRTVAVRCLTVSSVSCMHDAIFDRHVVRFVSRLYERRQLTAHRGTENSMTSFCALRFSAFQQSTLSCQPEAAAATTTTTTTTSGQSSLVELRRCGRRVLVERIEVERNDQPKSSAELTSISRATDHDSAAAAAIRDLETLIDDAVDRRDNVAVDEFVDLKESLSGFVTAFLVRDPVTWRPLAAVLLEPFRAARAIRPRLALLHIVTSSQFTHVDQVGDLANLGCRLAVDLNRGFTACVSSVFYESPGRVAALRREDFFIVACLPQVGKLKTVQKQAAAPAAPAAAGFRGADGYNGKEGVKTAVKTVCGNKTGYSNSYLMYRRLDVQQDIQPLSESELERHADELCDVFTSPSGVSGHFDESAMWSMAPVVPCLPVTLLTNDGLPVRARIVGVDDVDRCYEAFLSLTKIDQGFRRDEIPTRRVFSRLYSRCWNVVIEEADTGRWIAIFSMSPSPFSRSRKSVVCDISLIVMPEFRNRRRGVAAGLSRVLMHLMKDLGFEAVLADTAIDNIQAVFLMAGRGMLAVGSLPDAMSARNMADRSTDVVILYLPLE